MIRMQHGPVSEATPALSERRLRVKLALVAVLAMASVPLLLACQDGLGGLLISSADEVELGAGVDQEIEAQYRILDDNDPVAIWGNQLTQHLVNNSSAFRDPNEIGGYKVHVIYDDELINAFAAPGGFTYMTTGLILNADRCGEIAGVMGHEIAHVTQRHSVKTLEANFGIATLADWLLGDGLASDVAKTLQGFLSNTTFSQEHESEADSVGLQIAYSAGYNPYGLVDFFETLLELSGGSSGIPDFLSSHPATEDRIADTSAQIQRDYPDVVRNSTQTYNCIGTSMQLDEVKQRIQSGQLTVRPGTGTNPP